MIGQDIVVVEQETVQVVNVSPGQVDVFDPTDPIIIEVGIRGPQGIQGTQGPQGIQGPVGAGTFAYHHSQPTPSATWVIIHDLHGFPNITVVDSAGSKWEGDITYDSADQITVRFMLPFAGDAYLS